MAINISTDINVTTGGKLTDVGQIQGAWKTVDTLSDLYALTGSSFSKQKLQNGQVFYVSSSAALYTLNIGGSFPFVTYNFNEFIWPGTETVELNTFTGSIQSQVDSILQFTGSIQSQVDSILQFTGSYAVTGSNTFTDNQTIDGLLILTTQSVQPTFISGGLYLDSEYNLYLGSS